MGTVELKCTTDQDPTTANIFCLVSRDLNDDDGVRVRLVTDYSRLNNFVK